MLHQSQLSWSFLRATLRTYYLEVPGLTVLNRLKRAESPQLLVRPAPQSIGTPTGDPDFDGLGVLKKKADVSRGRDCI